MRVLKQTNIVERLKEIERDMREVSLEAFDPLVNRLLGEKKKN